MRARSGTLYGVTEQGGQHGAGTRFQVDTAGKITALYHVTPRGWNEPPLLALF
jgi:uncharacterized repeat protein (TIGR03803 family)